MVTVEERFIDYRRLFIISRCFVILNDHFRHCILIAILRCIAIRNHAMINLYGEGDLKDSRGIGAVERKR